VKTLSHRRLSGWVVLLAIVLASAAPASAEQKRGPRKIDRAVRQALAGGAPNQRVIVKVKPGYREKLRQALKDHGDVITSDHATIDAVGANLHSADLEELDQLDWVLDIAADAIVRADARKVAPLKWRRATKARAGSTASSQAAVTTLRKTLGLPAVVPPGTLGASGITVALIDSGIAPSADFANRITGFWDFTRGGIASPPYDDYGHGTHVAGLIGSSGVLSSYQFQGIAPDVRFVGLKVLDRTGAGYTSDVIDALEFVIANKSRLKVQIVNLSLGHPIYAPAENDPLVQAVERATAAGLIVVVSAGNFGQAEKGPSAAGYTGITSPGNARSAITVGATDTKNTVTRDDDVVAPYSSRGPSWFDAIAKPDVVAPGHQLASDTNLTSSLYKLLKSGHVISKNGKKLLQLSGSSMATGVATGVAALVLQAHNENGLRSRKPITANLMKGILQYSAIPLAGFDYLTQGAGQINAAGAIALGRAIDTDVAPGLPWFSVGVTPVTRIGGTAYEWGQDVIWGDAVYTGDVIYVSHRVWGMADGGDNIVWGTADEGDNIVWGTGVVLEAANIVWGTTNVWASNIVWGTRLIGAMSDDGDNIVWGTANDGDNIVWGTANDGDNIVWGTANDGDNIVWGTLNESNIVWGMRQGRNILFATSDGGDNIVWGTADGDNIVWGTADGGDNIVWGTADGGDNIVWGTAAGGF
jgi:serine protease AprX